jgi:hypothetical protein
VSNHPPFLLEKVAEALFSEHHCVGRQQKTWFLPATTFHWKKVAEALFSEHHCVGRQQKRGFCRLRRSIGCNFFVM